MNGDRGPVAALCFDLDGTLIRSEEIRDGVRRAYVAEAGGTWSAGAQRDMTGMRLADWAHYMHDHLAVDREPDRIALDIESRIETIYRSGVPLVAGARATLATCADIWPLALATGSTHRLIDLVLDLGDLRSFFRAVVSADDVGAGKPSPAVYLRAADLLGVDPGRCVAVEDSASGIRSARAAGMRVVAILGAARDSRTARPDADAIVSRLKDLTPDVVRAAANARA